MYYCSRSAYIYHVEVEKALLYLLLCFLCLVIMPTNRFSLTLILLQLGFLLTHENDTIFFTIIKEIVHFPSSPTSVVLKGKYPFWCYRYNCIQIGSHDQF